MKRERFLPKVISILTLITMFSCGGEQSNEAEVDVETVDETKEVTVYTHRHYDTDKQLFEEFTAQTGIKVNVVKAKADELIVRLQQEGKSSPADVLITVDAGRLHKAKSMDLLQSVESEVLNRNIKPMFRDPEGYWFGVTYRARILVYSKERVKPEELSTYEALTDLKWKGRLLIRSSENIYNQSLVASMVSGVGKDNTLAWCKGIVANLAQDPKGNDRDQVKSIAAGVGDVALVNSYYIGKMLNSDDAEEKKAGEKVAVFFPNQEGRGTHINISGAGICVNAPNKENAVKLLEFLSESKAQKLWAESNYEYPVLNGVEWAPLLQSWGEFKAEDINLAILGEYNKKAIETFNEAGWK